jgi:hypothetical protein
VQAYSQQEEEKVHNHGEKQGLQLKYPQQHRWVEEEQLQGGPNNVRLISSMLSIISKLHVCLEVDNPLNIWSIDHIGSAMVQHKHELRLEEGANAWRWLVVKNS